MPTRESRSVFSTKGYAMPAEWDAHEATWLAWPQNRAHWPELEKVEAVFDRIASEISRDENVYICVGDPETASRVKARLERAGARMDGTFFFMIPTHDVWIRDFGPTFLVDRTRKHGLAFVHWRFNAWGGKYPDIASDVSVPPQIGALLGVEGAESDIVLEGGSIDVDGEGTVLTTEQCLLHPNRNPSLERAGIEARVNEAIGTEKIIWLAGGIAGDDTDGHVDDVARFTAPGEAVAVLPDDASDPDYRILKENLDRLRAAVDARGRKIDVKILPAPDPVLDRGEKLPASYANFYLTNGAVLVPTFGCESDERALKILAAAFPSRRAVGIRCEELVRGLGAIHCATQQQPAGR